MTIELKSSVDARRQNSFLANVTSFFNRMTTQVEVRRKALTMFKDDALFHPIQELATKFAGRRPSWHIERKLLERFKLAGFGKYFQDFNELAKSDFDEQLEKGEKLMVSQAEFKGDKRALISAAHRVYMACEFPHTKFNAVSLEYAFDNQINHRSSSGFPAFQRKGKLKDELIKEAEHAIKNPNSTIWFWPCVRGFRLQLREFKNELSRKVRLMYPYPGFIILIEDTFIMPFVEHFISTNTFYVIGKNGKQISKALKERFNNSKQICSLDVSAFDQNLVNEAIILAFGILRNQLKLTKEQAITYENVVKYFCTNIMVSRDHEGNGYSFVKHHGVPSGSGFTNMIDTIAHAIVFEYLQPGILSKRRTLICGDDNIFDSHGIKLNNLFLGYEQIFNLPIDPIKTDIYPNGRYIKFLGFVWINYIRHINYKLAINQCLWHTDFLTELSEFDRHVARCASVLLNGKNGSQIFEKVFPDVMANLQKGIDVRFVYLTGYSPPSAKESPSLSISLTSHSRNSTLNESLKEHLRDGYLIR